MGRNPRFPILENCHPDTIAFQEKSGKIVSDTMIQYAKMDTGEKRWKLK